MLRLLQKSAPYQRCPSDTVLMRPFRACHERAELLYEQIRTPTPSSHVPCLAPSPDKRRAFGCAIHLLRELRQIRITHQHVRRPAGAATVERFLA